MVVAWRRTSSARPSQYSASKPLDGTLSPNTQVISVTPWLGVRFLTLARTGK